MAASCASRTPGTDRVASASAMSVGTSSPASCARTQVSGWKPSGRAIANLPATGAISALITKAIGKEPYVVGKPNPMMFRSALNRIGAHSENTGMIGDRMDTDVVAGIEAGRVTGPAGFANALAFTRIVTALPFASFVIVSVIFPAGVTS